MLSTHYVPSTLLGAFFHFIPTVTWIVNSTLLRTCLPLQEAHPIAPSSKLTQPFGPFMEHLPPGLQASLAVMGRRRQRPGSSMRFPGLALCWLQRVTGGGNSDLRELPTVLTLSPPILTSQPRASLAGGEGVGVCWALWKDELRARAGSGAQLGPG